MCGRALQGGSCAIRMLVGGRTWHDRYEGVGEVLTEHVSGAQGGGRTRFRFSKPNQKLKTLPHNVSCTFSGRSFLQESTAYLLVLGSGTVRRSHDAARSTSLGWPGGRWRAKRRG